MVLRPPKMSRRRNAMWGGEGSTSEVDPPPEDLWRVRSERIQAISSTASCSMSAGTAILEVQDLGGTVPWSQRANFVSVWCAKLGASPSCWATRFQNCDYPTWAYFFSRFWYFIRASPLMMPFYCYHCYHKSPWAYLAKSWPRSAKVWSSPFSNTAWLALLSTSSILSSWDTFPFTSCNGFSIPLAGPEAPTLLLPSKILKSNTPTVTKMTWHEDVLSKTTSPRTIYFPHFEIHLALRSYHGCC